MGSYRAFNAGPRSTAALERTGGGVETDSGLARETWGGTLAEL